jgi:hypothetical protein
MDIVKKRRCNINWGMNESERRMLRKYIQRYVRMDRREKKEKMSDKPLMIQI